MIETKRKIIGLDEIERKRWTDREIESEGDCACVSDLGKYASNTFYALRFVCAFVYALICAV